MYKNDMYFIDIGANDGKTLSIKLHYTKIICK